MGYSIDYQSGKKRSYGQYRWKFIPIVLLFLSLYLRLMQPQIHRFMKDILISEITDVILNKLEEFFKIKIEKGIIREVNPKSLAIMCFGMLFQSVILWKIYNKDLEFETNSYADDLINIMFEGINP